MNIEKQWYLQQIGIDVWRERDIPVFDVGADSVELIEEDMANKPQIASLDWHDLKTAVSQCRACELHCHRTQTVFGVGSKMADLLIIGEAPGEEEDRLGEPFVGRSGKLLDQMLRAIGLDRQQIYIANILKCRPPSNRDPKPEEQAQCTPFLKQQLELLQPKLILALGKVAAQYLLESNETLGSMRNQDHCYNNIPLIVSYHPAYLLRSPKGKAKSYADLLRVKEMLSS